MSTLFDYQPTALMAAEDDDYIRLEIKATPRETGKEIYCKQIEIKLPVGAGAGHISTLPPTPFVDTPRWIASQGPYSESRQSYFFDDTKAGEVPMGGGPFWLGFRIEKAELLSLTGFKIPLTEKSSHTRDAAGFQERTVELEVSFKVIKPSILYFIAEKNDEPCTHFTSTDTIQLSWKGSLIEDYVLYVGDQKGISMEQSETHPLGALKKDTSIILEGTGHLGTDILKVYHTLTITISDPTLIGSTLAVGHPWDDGNTTTPVRIGKPGNGHAGSGLDAGVWSAGSAFMHLYDVKEGEGSINRGTNIGFCPHPWGGTVEEKLTIAANGNVGIGTTVPAAKLEVNGDIRTNQALIGGTLFDGNNAAFSHKDLGTDTGFALRQHKDGDTYLNGKQIHLSVNNEEKMTLASNGIVRIGAENAKSKPSDKALLSLSRGYAAGSGTGNAILEICTGNSANGYLWGADDADWDEFNVSFNYYRYATHHVVPNQGGYGAGCMTLIKTGDILFKTSNETQGRAGTAPTEKMRLTADGNLSVQGTIQANEALISSNGWGAGYAGFAHKDQGRKGHYALMQHKDGDTYVNTPSGKKIHLRVNNDDKMVVDKDGNVGIGRTPDSKARLHVKGPIFAEGPGIIFAETGANHTGWGNTEGHAAIENAADFNALMILGRQVENRGRCVKVFDHLDVGGELRVHGNVWIKPQNDTKMYVFNRGGVGGNFAFLDASDQRLKANISALSNPLEKLTALNGVHFEWNEKGNSLFTKDIESSVRAASGAPEDDQKIWAEEKQKIRDRVAGRHWGFVAQDVEKVFPEWVGTNEAGYKTLNTAELLPLLVEGIKQQQGEIEQLKEALARLSE